MDLVLSATMMLVYFLLTVFSVFANIVQGCTEGNGHDHEHTDLKRSVPSLPLTPPSRPLEWGDINILHTTDTHGWLLGHQKSSFPEPNYSGDLGDFASFVAHMKQIALEKDVDLLLVDSGDLHDGTGLSDGYPPGGVDAHESNQFLKQIPYDVMAIGNHELYIYENTLDMHQNFAPALNGRYLSSNVNITYTDARNITRDVPVGSRFAKFKTRKGRRVTAFGVLFDFAGNDDNTTVQKVADMVKETWFLDAIQDEPDLFLLAGHMPVVRDKWPLVFDAIRAIHPNTPITILGGHSHIRDCVQLDKRSMSLESGRYMETIGWMGLNFKGHPRSHANLTFSRRYLDANKVTYEYHTGRVPSAFDTEQGVTITQGLHDLAARFDLNFTYGIAPQDYTLSQSPYPSKDSLLTLVIEEAAPYALSINNPRSPTPNITVISSGNQRFNIFAGPFTKNDQLTASPFMNSFGYIQDVPLGTVLRALQALNGGENAAKRSAEREQAMYRMGDVRTRYLNWLEDMDRRYGVERREAMDNLTLGYVTTDSCPGVGDDIVHTPLPFFPTPDFVASRTPDVSNDTAVDFVFLDFNTGDAVEALNGVQTDKVYSENGDVQLYSESVRTNELMGIYAQAFWN